MEIYEPTKEEVDQALIDLQRAFENMLPGDLEPQIHFYKKQPEKYDVVKNEKGEDVKGEKIEDSKEFIASFAAETLIEMKIEKLFV